MLYNLIDYIIKLNTVLPFYTHDKNIFIYSSNKLTVKIYWKNENINNTFNSNY